MAHVRAVPVSRPRCTSPARASAHDAEGPPDDHRHRAGAARRARLLLGDGDLPHRPGRPGRPGRPQRRRQDHADPGAGRRGAAGRRAGHPLRAVSATCRRTRAPATSTSLARDRILSARGLDTVLRRMRDTEGEMASADAATHERAMRRYAAAGGGVPGRRRVRRRERGRRDRVQPRPARPGARPAAADPVRRSAPPRRAGPDPLLRRGHRRGQRHPAARRADQPPRRRLDRLAARLPQDLQGRARRHQPRRRPARARS